MYGKEELIPALDSHVSGPEVRSLLCFACGEAGVRSSQYFYVMELG